MEKGTIPNIMSAIGILIIIYFWNKEEKTIAMIAAICILVVGNVIRLFQRKA